MAGSKYPGSAISSWSGFVYQGKIALHHSLSLLNDKKQSPPNFELQLDSVDDFAVYSGPSVQTTHQVKAKGSHNRTSYADALEKASQINKDCTPLTIRYFHVAQKLDDHSDYTSNGVTVKFYNYGTDKHCSISQAEPLSKALLQSITENENIPFDPTVIERSYCALSELIQRHVLAVHQAIHDGESQDEAAYNRRIKGVDLLAAITATANDSAVKAIDLQRIRAKFIEVLEEYATEEHQDAKDALERIHSSIFFILSLQNPDLQKAILSMLMDPDALTLRDTDLANYSDVLALVPGDLLLNTLPHFSTSKFRYLPTAITIKSRQAQWYKTKLQRALDENPELISLAYEFNTLIASSDIDQLIINENDDLIIGNSAVDDGDNIFRKPALRIVSPSTAAKEML
jgi:hypothetical protein